MNSFRDHVNGEQDQFVLASYAKIWRTKVNSATHAAERLRQKMAETQKKLDDAELDERQARENLEAVAARRESLHRAAEAPDRAALAASAVDITLDVNEPKSVKT